MPVEIPKDLVERTAAGKTVLFVGAGMSMPELPGWEELLHEMVAWCGDRGIRVNKESINELIAEKDFLLAATQLREEMPNDTFCDFLRWRFRDQAPPPKDAHHLVPKLGLRRF